MDYVSVARIHCLFLSIKKRKHQVSLFKGNGAKDAKNTVSNSKAFKVNIILKVFLFYTYLVL
jgi:hypothetical protein